MTVVTLSVYHETAHLSTRQTFLFRKISTSCPFNVDNRRCGQRRGQQADPQPCRTSSCRNALLRASRPYIQLSTDTPVDSFAFTASIQSICTGYPHCGCYSGTHPIPSCIIRPTRISLFFQAYKLRSLRTGLSSSFISHPRMYSGICLYHLHHLHRMTVRFGPQSQPSLSPIQYSKCVWRRRRLRAPRETV